MSFSHGQTDPPRSLWGNQGTKVLFILSCRYASDFASVQAPASSSDVVFIYPLAPPFKTQILGILFPVMNPGISLLHLSIQAQSCKTSGANLSFLLDEALLSSVPASLGTDPSVVGRFPATHCP